MVQSRQQRVTDIAKVETFHLAIPSVYGGPPPRGTAQWPKVQMLFVRVETEGGLVGWGEAFGHMACATTKVALDTLVKPFCLKADASDIAGLGAHLRRSLHAYGLGSAVAYALSGIDIALWDIRGKLEGKPLYRLLNDKADTATVPAYASLLRYGDDDLAGVAAADAVARGHKAVKLHEASVEAVAEARKQIGPDIALTLDVNCRWTVEEGIDAAKKLKPHNLKWLEEPCWPPTSEVLAQVGAQSGVAMAAGENALSLMDLERIATVGKARYIQPSASKIGGVSGLLEARAIAEKHGVEVAPHSAYFGPGFIAAAQFCAAFGLSCEWYDCRLETIPTGVAPRDGAVMLSQKPGLGIEIDSEVLARYRVS